MYGPGKKALIDYCEEIAIQQHKEDGGEDGDGGLLTREEIEEDIDNPFPDEE